MYITCHDDVELANDSIHYIVCTVCGSVSMSLSTLCSCSKLNKHHILPYNSNSFILMLTSLLVLFPVSGAAIGFAMTSYSGAEGTSVEVCVTVHSVNMTILSMSEFEGHFKITENGEYC